MIHPADGSVERMRGTWWVAHTLARCEKAFAWDLQRAGGAEVAYFLPLMGRVSFSGGRKRRVLRPLFASYVFICGEGEIRHKALLTGRLCQVIPVPNQQQLIRELAQLERVLIGKAEFDPYPFAAVGRRCRVKVGPFEGVEGTVTERESVTSLVLQVSLLGQGIALHIDTDVLEAVDREPLRAGLAGAGAF